jgi:shikimate dehydrogenase
MRFGLIGYPLSHSFSKAYFTEKFSQQGLQDFTYDLFPIARIEDVYDILRSDVMGLNVTIPFKTSIIDYINDIHPQAFQIGAVNTIARTGQYSWKGFNTDASGFRQCIQQWFGNNPLPSNALILGSGGTSKAVAFILADLGIKALVVSGSGKGDLSYQDLSREMMESHHLVVNTTPLGMHPDILSCPDIPYQYLTSQHWVFDVIYNPANTLFLTRSQQMGARTKNGLDMLHLQADHAWAIWKNYGNF